MEPTEKDRARMAWRASHRRQGGRGRGAPKAPQRAEELESNEFRYDEADEEAEMEPGQFPRQSKGADLMALLEENLQWDRNLMYRSRKQLDMEAEEALPPGAMEAAEKALVIDYEDLARSLAQLSLHQLLGVEEELFPMDKLPSEQKSQSTSQPPTATTAAPTRTQTATEPESAHHPAKEAVQPPSLAQTAEVRAPAIDDREKAAERDLRGGMSISVSQSPQASAAEQKGRQESGAEKRQPPPPAGDAELDELLDMANTKAPVPAATTSKAETKIGSSAAGNAQDNLEDWLNSL